MDNDFEAEKINTDKAPKAAGPYSQAVKAGNLIFCSGQIGINPEMGKLVEGGVAEEIRQVIKNLEMVLTAAGSNLNKVLQTTIYITDMNNYAEVNALYAESFKTEPLPARATVEVSKLPAGASIEISCIAYI
jgi:2-iminobutanoate/2-iminopropanoate deaminase